MTQAPLDPMIATERTREVAVIEFLTANWLVIAVIVFFVAMHRRGHGCGAHGHHRSRESGTQSAHHGGSGRSAS